MNKNDLRRLAGLETLKEEKWSADVKEKKHPPEGLFANGSVKSIVEWLQANHGDYKSAMSSLNFYINRSGKNLIASRKAELEKAKNALRRAYGIKEGFDLELIRKMAGLPAIVSEEDTDDEEYDKEPEEETPETENDEESEEHEDDLPTIVKKIAAQAVGKSEEELEELIDQVYKAGFEDCKTEMDAQKSNPTGTEEMSEPEEAKE